MTQKKDYQTDMYQLTINNPQNSAMSHDDIKKILIQQFKTPIYFCMADEKGSCYHTHVFVCFSSRVRFSTIKKRFPTAHIEAVKGTASENINYVKKSGKWKDDIKHGTQIENTFEEFGTPPPDSRGRDKAMTELYNMIQDGLSNAEIIARNQDYILQIDKIDKLRTILLTEKYRGTRRLDLEVTYVSGVTGSGKTRDIFDAFGDENVYRVTDYQHPFDGYNHFQPVIVFDEFRSSLPLKDMLHYLDIYPIELPARYANRYAGFNKVFLVSNWPLEQQYKEHQDKDRESWDAFLRRIHKVNIYDGTQIQCFDSVKAYLGRDLEWQAMDCHQQAMEDFPFNN